MANEVKIRVTADQKGADLGRAKAESDELKNKVEADSKAMKTASDNYTKAKRQEEDAAGRVRVAELKLQEIREKGNTTALQRARAEESYAKAVRDSKTAEESAATAAEKLAVERDKLNNPVVEEVKTKATVDTKGNFDFSKGLKDAREALLSEAKTDGIEAGAIMAGGLAAGLTPTAAAGIFVGIAAAAQSSNQQVRAAYSQMWDQVKAGAQDASSELSTDFINGAEKLGQTFLAIKPELTEGFIAAKPVVNDLFDGIDRGARVAMPGFVTAAEAGKDASKGFADMLQGTGQGVANFFTESSKGAAAAGDDFRSFGNIVERLGSFAGRIIAELANNSVTLFPQVESTVNATANAVENLAHVALPSIASGAGLALSGVSALMNLANALISVLGPLIPMASTFATSLKLIDMVSFGQVGASWDRLKSSISDAEGFAGKAKAGFQSLASSGFGPLLLGGVAVTGLLNELSKDQQAAAEAAHVHEQNVSSLASALRQSKGAIDDNVRASAAQALSNIQVGQTGDKVLQTANQLGVSLPMLTDGFLGNKEAMGAVYDQLNSLIEAGTTYEETNSSKQAIETTSAEKARILKQTLEQQNGTMNDAVLMNKALAGATGQAADTTNTLADAFKSLYDKAGSAQTKVQALMDIMDKMAGRKPEVEDATRAWEDLIDKLNVKAEGFSGFDKLQAGSKKWASALIEADGTINTTVDDGRKLYDTVREGEKDFANTAEAMKANGASAQEVQAKLQGMRDEFIKNMQAMGFTADQAKALADKYGLIPENVSTLVSSNLAPEIQKALSLGGTIRSLPDGSFVVTANTSAAQAEVTKFIQTNTGKVITLHVNTTSGVVTNTSGGTFSRYQAAGGPAQHAAEGGARTGPVLVNEYGRMEGIRTPSGDLIDMEDGSQVVPAANMASMRGHGAPARVEIVFGDDGSELGALLVKLVQRYVKINGGGDVQLALGRAS